MNKSVNVDKEILLMPYEDKIYLYFRCYIIEQNKKFEKFLKKFLTNEEYIKIKSEIAYHLFNKKYLNEFNKSYNLLKQSKNIYANMDTYTLCVYSFFYDKILEYPYNEPTKESIRRAKETIYNNVKDLFKIKNLNFENNINIKKINYLLKQENREETFNHLKKFLKIENHKKFVLEILEKEFKDTKTESEKKINKYYKESLEEYIDEKGNPYYLDYEGNLINNNDIEDYEL